MNKDISIELFLDKLFGRCDNDLKCFFEQISRLKEFNKKETIFFEGDRGENFYFLVKGKVKLYKISPHGKEVIVKIVNSGEIFAEATLLEPIYPVNAVTLNNSIVLKINSRDFWVYLTSNPELLKVIFLLFFQRIKLLLSRLEVVGTENVEERVFNYLISVSDKINKPFKLPISKTELANLLFTTPETISRTFKKLKEKGIIEIKGRDITIKKIDDF